MEFPKYDDFIILNEMLFYFGIFIRKQNQDTTAIRNSRINKETEKTK